MGRWMNEQIIKWIELSEFIGEKAIQYTCIQTELC